jgi:uncharacterized protein (TIGR03790 family)
MRRIFHRAVVGMMLLNCFLCKLLAGGSGLNTVVVVNQASSNSCALGNYFCERRSVPPENVLRILWAGGNTVWTSNDFQTVLLTPLRDMLTARRLTNQVDYVVLSMDLPFQTTVDSVINGTTTALFYGPKTSGVANSYAGSEAVFRQAQPTGSPGFSFLTTMLTANSLAQAKQLVDQGVASDGTQPAQPVVLAKSSDLLRNIRFTLFDNAIFNVKIRNNASILRTNTDSLWGGTGFLGYETGLANFTVPAGVFVPGAIADSLTSFGGIIFGPNSQTSLLAMISAGASGSYGTVAEPGTDAQKFPNPQVYFYQSRGFSLAESYYLSLNVPYQGLVVAEPLAAPFQQLANGHFVGVSNTLSGMASLKVQFTAHDAIHPLQQIDLFVDGQYFSTLTNLSPRPGTLLNIEFNGYPVSYTVPAGATIGMVSTGLVAALNASAVTNFTQATAVAFGDRIELRSQYCAPANSPFYVIHNETNSGNNFYSVDYLPYPVPPQVTLPTRDPNGTFRFQVNNPDVLACVIEASTNLSAWLPIDTNLAGGTWSFTDPDATNIQSRFYRVLGLAGTPPAPAPPIYSVQAGPNGSDLIQIDSATRPYLVQVSADQVQWTPFFTNLTPGLRQVIATSSLGNADALTTGFRANRAAFLDSEAFGRRQYLVVKSSLSSGAYLQFEFTKTNGTVVAVGLTNQTASASSTNFTKQVYDLLNATPALLGSDGVAAEDFSINSAGTASFNLRPRSPGWPAANIQVLPRRSGVTILPYSSTPVTLTQNRSDLQPRNHLYVTAGVTDLQTSFSLDTTQLPDGYHEFTAVAYEGSHVRTQTHATIPVCISNSPLFATLTLLDLTNNAPAEATYHIQVNANTNNVSLTTLFSTGGAMGYATNDSAPVFEVNGAALWTGRHPFYAIVETASGQKFRTQTTWIRLQ